MLKHLYKALLIPIIVSISLASIGQALAQTIQNKGFGARTYSYHRYTHFVDQAATQTHYSPEIQNAVDKVAPAVVDVYGYRDSSPGGSQNSTEGFPFFGADGLIITPQIQNLTQVDAGTGFFITPTGYILTANHVVGYDNARYVVQLSDGKNVNADVVYRDMPDDVAILKIPGNNFPAVHLGDSSSMQNDETVVALGNALGQMHNMVSVGNVVPMMGNLVMDDSTNSSDSGQLPQHLFQSNMQLYPGHSGGPTFDLEGNVIGINDAIAADQPNVSFSIPINDARDAIGQVVPQF